MTDRPTASGGADARLVAYPAQKLWRQRNPAARTAHLKVQRAKLKGIVVPRQCEWPGCRETKTDAHHDDYSQPLKVKWFCRKHHKARHRQMRCEAVSKV